MRNATRNTFRTWKVGSSLLACAFALQGVSAGGPRLAGDEAGLRAARSARGHAVHATAEGHAARNPGQGWTLHFDGSGFAVRPDVGEWTWGLELVRYGFAGCESVVQASAGATVAGGRVAYAWSATLEEWYVNDARGLEHGFTLSERPERGTATGARTLNFVLAVRGALRPGVAANGRDVAFVDERGSTVLTYNGLTVLDAVGRELKASFEVVGDELRLAIDERGATYPLTIDPVAQQAYLKASNCEAQDRFGIDVSVSGDTAVVGANFERSSVTGVNGDASDNGTFAAGAAYVYQRAGGGFWHQQAYLKASNTGVGDQFGTTVAISGDTIVVGAPAEDGGATGVNGDESDNTASEAGSAYVFVRNGTDWVQQAYLKASNAEAFDLFGLAVAIDGDVVVVGAVNEDSGTTGVDGNQADNSATNSGAAYVFVRSGTTWTQQAYLKASNTGSSDHFATSLSVSGDTIVIGSEYEASASSGVNGDDTDDSAFGAGATYVFVRTGSTWSQEAYLKASNAEADDRFGHAVGISVDTVVVGAHHESSNAIGVNANQADNSASQAGAAYLFMRNGTSWSQVAYVKPQNTEAFDTFGSDVAVSGGTVVVGASGEDSGSAGIGGNAADNSKPDAGAVYVFAASNSVWTQRGYLKASSPDGSDFFGFVVAASCDTALVGAFGEDSASAFVNGDQSSNSAPGAGAAYAFDLDLVEPPTSYCSAKTTSVGCVPVMLFTGVPSATAADFSIIGHHMVPNEAGTLLYSFQKSNLNFHGGKLCVKAPFVRTPAKAAKNMSAPSCPPLYGRLTRNFNAIIQSGADPQLTPGQTVFAQWRQRDPADPAGFGDALSGGLRFVICP